MTDADEEAIGPDVAELEQYDTGPAVDVRMAGPVRTHALPARVAHSRNITVTDVSQPEQIGNEDLRRSYCTIIATGQPIYVGHDKQAVLDGTAAILPVSIPLTLPTAAPVYVRAAAVGAAVVSYWAGQWAD